MKPTKQKKERVELTQREAFVQNAVRKGKENFPSPSYPGQFIDREIKVVVKIKEDSPWVKKSSNDESSLPENEQLTELKISVDLFKAPDHLVSLLEKKEGFDGLNREQIQELWQKRKNYRYEYTVLVKRFYAEQVITTMGKK